MCGIFGFSIQQRLSLDNIQNIMKTMLKQLNHRGPDDNGIWTNGIVGLGHTRLSIIDLSPQARQPMTDNDDQIKIVFNGEIYNFKILKKELQLMGCVFKTKSDTEVILNGYLTWGKALFSKLRGMFAIAIWDARTEELILVRDSIGKKPLYYGFCTKGSLVFASEIKAIVCWPTIVRNPNLNAIHHFLSFQYIPAPLTAFTGIKQVPHGHFIVFNKNLSYKIEKYWHLQLPQKFKEKSVSQLKTELIDLLKESVQRRLVADVPVGALLSGGIDSSAVVAMMSLYSTEKIKTFSVGFREKSYDERKFARIISNQFNTEHHELVIDPSAIEILPKLIWHYDQPFADPSAIPSFYVSEFARKHVKVVLTGDGGDENFIGYGRYESCLRYLTRNSFFDRMKINLKDFFIERHKKSNLHSRLYSPFICYFSDEDKKSGYGEALIPYLEASSLDILEFYFSQTEDIIEGASWADINTYLIDDILVKMDIASMANSLEVRSPFLDQDLMKWALSVPSSQKLLGNTLKGLLKVSLGDYLPSEILHRKKMGFGIPIDEWFKKELKEMAFDILLSNQAASRNLLQRQYVQKMLEEHCTGIRAHHTRLWALLVLELWYRTWIDSDGSIVDINNEYVYANAL